MPPVLEPEALHRALADPACVERFSVLAGCPVLAVALSTPPRADFGDEPLQALAGLACVVVGVGGGANEPRRLAAACDVRVADAAALGELSTAVSRTPLAALALVQLLRGGEGRSVREGLLAESLVYSTLQAGPEFAAWLAARPAPAARAPEAAPLRVTREGDALALCLARPQKRNAFSAALRDAYCEALALARSDPGIRRVLLRGEGAAFCSGGDLDEFGTLPDPATAHAIRSTRSPAAATAAVGAKLSSRVHGACIGAGIELPAFGAHVSAAPDAFFQLPELAMGLVPGAGGTVSLPRRIGRQRTAWLALTGARLDAGRALAWGLVDVVEERARSAPGSGR